MNCVDQKCTLFPFCSMKLTTILLVSYLFIYFLLNLCIQFLKILIIRILYTINKKYIFLQQLSLVKVISHNVQCKNEHEYWMKVVIYLCFYSLKHCSALLPLYHANAYFYACSKILQNYFSLKKLLQFCVFSV